MVKTSLFDKGLVNEQGEVDRISKGIKSYHWLIEQIGASDDVFLARRYASEMRQTADALKKSRGPYDEEANFLISVWAELANRLERQPSRANTLIPTDRREAFKIERQGMIIEAIINYIPLPESIWTEVDQIIHKQGGTLRCYKAWLKARGEFGDHVSEDLYQDYGVKIRRQDGKPVRQSEIVQVRDGLDELFAMIGNISPLIRSVVLSIIHTGGKHIFHSGYRTQGIYYSISKSAVVGVNDLGKPSIHSLVHEVLGHWLDRAAAPLDSVLRLLFHNANLPNRLALTLSYLDAEFNTRTLFRSALDTMTGIKNIHSSSYLDWLMPTEVFARLVEQYLSLKLRRYGVKYPISVREPEFYMNHPGYWSLGAWEDGLYEQMHQQLEGRLELARLFNGLQPDIRLNDPIYPLPFDWLLPALRQAGMSSKSD